MTSINPYLNNIQAIFHGGRVRRYHTRPVIGDQSNSAHSWGVAALVLAICPTATRALLVAALLHDVAEYETGDIPATTKWASPTLKSALDEMEAGVEARLGISSAGLSATERKILKLADMLELVLFCRYQVRLGNAYMAEIEDNGLLWLKARQEEWENDPQAASSLLALTFLSIERILKEDVA